MEEITKQWLDQHPNAIFVFGDNLYRSGHGGAAKLRDHPQSYGFITKRKPTNNDDAFYNKKTYTCILCSEMRKLRMQIDNDNKTYYISALGSGLANKHHIWKIIKPVFKELKQDYPDRIILVGKKWE